MHASCAPEARFAWTTCWLVHDTDDVECGWARPTSATPFSVTPFPDQQPLVCQDSLLGMRGNRQRTGTLTWKPARCRLQAEGFSETDVQKAVPYAAQAMSIATACVGGVGLATAGLVYASGVDFKDKAQVSGRLTAWHAPLQCGTFPGHLSHVSLIYWDACIGVLVPAGEQRQRGVGNVGGQGGWDGSGCKTQGVGIKAPVDTLEARGKASRRAGQPAVGRFRDALWVLLVQYSSCTGPTFLSIQSMAGPRHTTQQPGIEQPGLWISPLPVQSSASPECAPMRWQ
jgi:hypothetical protein